MDVNSLPKSVTRQRRDCDLNPGPTVPESSTLTTRLPSHPVMTYTHVGLKQVKSQFESQSGNKRSDGRTRPIAVSCPLTRSIINFCHRLAAYIQLSFVHYSRRLSRVVQCRSFLTVIFIHAVYRVLRRCAQKKDSRFIIMKLKGEICVNKRGLSPKRRSIGCVVFSQVSHLSQLLVRISKTRQLSQ